MSDEKRIIDALHEVLQGPVGRDYMTYLETLLAEEEEEKPKVFKDPGPDYDEEQEKIVRDMMTQVADYAEEGVKFDPEGTYLCGDCQMRIKPDACATVSGKISMKDGSCEKWMIGPQSWPIQIVQWSQKEASYAERPKAKGFGCSRCGHGDEALLPDADGRTMWCDRFGARVYEQACCAEEGGDDMIEAPGE